MDGDFRAYSQFEPTDLQKEIHKTQKQRIQMATRTGKGNQETLRGQWDQVGREDEDSQLQVPLHQALQQEDDQGALLDLLGRVHRPEALDNRGGHAAHHSHW